MTAGTVYPAEWRTFRDPQTGREVTQLTDSSAEDYHLYFYNPTVTANGHFLIFYSERTGLSNMFRLDLTSGEIVQLTDAAPTRAEYWPFTAPLKGVASCLSAIGSGGREVFYFEGDNLMGVDVETCQSRHLLTVPAERRPSMLNADASGETLVFATWDEDLFAKWSQEFYSGSTPFTENAIFQQTASTLIRVEAASGQSEEVLRIENFWINHVLINPIDRDQFLFCHEYTSLPDRMWLLNVATGKYAAIPGQGSHEWYEHEFWSLDGQRIYVHAGLNNDDTNGFCSWLTPDGAEHHQFHHFTPGRIYAHYNLHPGGDVVTDGEAKPGCISRVRLIDGKQDFEVLCRHDSYKVGDDQRCHPHPSFTPDGKRVVFTSNQSGSSNVYITNWD